MKKRITTKELKTLRSYGYKGGGDIGGMIEYLGEDWHEDMISVSCYDCCGSYDIIPSGTMVRHLYERVERKAHEEYFNKEVKKINNFK